MHGADPAALDDAALTDLLAEFCDEMTLVLAVSGGPDSMGMLAAFWRWRQGLDHGPVLEIATVDHGLRAQSRAECELVVESAERLGLPATILTWTGDKPETALQSAARTARYQLLAGHAQSV
ncbi:MAG: ATP-binding protein, partial [Alphaproteobacteria bacterium]